jgi:hypothetical protein
MTMAMAVCRVPYNSGIWIWFEFGLTRNANDNVAFSRAHTSQMMQVLEWLPTL